MTPHVGRLLSHFRPFGSSLAAESRPGRPCAPQALYSSNFSSLCSRRCITGKAQDTVPWCVYNVCVSVKKKPTRTRSGRKVKTVSANLPEEEARFDVGLLVTSRRLNSANKLIVGSVLVFVVKTGYHQVTVPQNFPLPISIFPQNWPVKIPVATSSHIFRNGPHSCSSFMVHSLCTYSKNLNEQLSLS